jgi:hypothetical protein
MPNTKKIFSQPRLRVYGDIAKITQAVGAGGAGDDSGTLMLKTAP